jgi:hypothetical protein
MHLLVRCFVVAVVSLTFGACRQADGPIPVPSEDVQQDLNDVVRDLQNVAAAKDPQAPSDLASDLRKYSVRRDAEPTVDELTRRTVTALSGIELPEQSAQRLAHSLWVSIAARELSERQIESLQSEMRLMLTSLGVSESNAQLVADQVGDVQIAVGDRPRRWYELF